MRIRIWQNRVLGSKFRWNEVIPFFQSLRRDCALCLRLGSHAKCQYRKQASLPARGQRKLIDKCWGMGKDERIEMQMSDEK
mmetsp:Transcript_9793/g.18668  ORF Transcript_9793/g.18668 Transcript_9793/m.18668 type:complete len:81 (+) Transcript_9793:141-383(+)